MSTPNGPDVDDAGGDVTLTCDVCDESVTGPAKGKGSAVWKLGRHRYVKHKMTTGGKGSAADKRAGAELEDSPRQVIASVTSIAAAMGSRSGPPNADELARGLGRGLGLTTLAVASWMVDTDQSFGDGAAADQERDRIADQLSLSDKAARDVMAPIARAFAPTRVNQRFGRGVVDNVDVVGSLAELATLAAHWRRYLHDRSAGRGAAAITAPGAYVAPPAFDEAAPLTTPAPQSGHVVGAEEVQRLLAARAAAGA